MLSYIPLFVRYPSTRDLPWVNLLLFVLAGGLLAVGLKRAYSQPDRYRGKVSGILLSLLTLVGFGLFCWGNFVFARQIPSASSAPRVGQQAPEFMLADASGKQVALSDILKNNRAVLLIFYRGYW